MKVDLKTRKEITVTVDVEFPLYFKRAVPREDSGSFSFLKIDKDIAITIEEEWEMYENSSSYELLVEPTGPITKWGSYILNPEQVSSESEFMNAEKRLLKFIHMHINTSQ